MFNKLLKYEMKAIWRYWWIIAASVVGLSFLGAFTLRFTLTASEHNVDLEFFATMTTLVTMLIVLCIFASFLVTEILVFIRYYKNFFTDEGYLTFTLPVSRRQLLAAKMLNGLIWTLAHILLLAMCGLFIFGIISPPPAEGGGFFNFVILKEIGEFLSEAWNEMGGGWMIVLLTEIFMLMVASLAFSQALLYLCITFGSVIAKKAKLLAAIGVYYAINFSISMVLRIFGLILTVGVADGISHLFPYDTPAAANGCVTLIIIIIICIISALAAIAYCITQSLLERKLNLP